MRRRANAICERFVGSLRRECLDHMLVIGERQLIRVLKGYVSYFNPARPHQGIAQPIPAPRVLPPGEASSLSERTGGLSVHYRHDT